MNSGGAQVNLAGNLLEGPARLLSRQLHQHDDVLWLEHWSEVSEVSFHIPELGI